MSVAASKFVQFEMIQESAVAHVTLKPLLRN